MSQSVFWLKDTRTPAWLLLLCPLAVRADPWHSSSPACKAWALPGLKMGFPLVRTCIDCKVLPRAFPKGTAQLLHLYPYENIAVARCLMLIVHPGGSGTHVLFPAPSTPLKVLLSPSQQVWGQCLCFALCHLSPSSLCALFIVNDIRKEY